MLCHKCFIFLCHFFYKRNLKNERINHNKLHSMCHVNVFRIRFVVSGFACNRERSQEAGSQLFLHSIRTHNIKSLLLATNVLPFAFPSFPFLCKPYLLPLYLFPFFPFYFFLRISSLSSRKRIILAQFLSSTLFPSLTPLLNQPIRLSNEKVVWDEMQEERGIIWFLADSQLSRVRLRPSYVRMSCRRRAPLSSLFAPVARVRKLFRSRPLHSTSKNRR